jgi:hypothetical protein
MDDNKLAGDGSVEAKIKNPCDMYGEACVICVRPWEKYFQVLEKRIEAGAIEYGDKSFDKSVSSLIGEIQEEILDIAGWGYILWEKLERLKKTLQ